MNSHTTHPYACLPRSELRRQATAMAVGNNLRRAAGSRVKPRRISLQRCCRRGRAPGGCPREVEEGDEAASGLWSGARPPTSNAEPSPSSLEKLHHSELRDALAVLSRSSRRPPFSPSHIPGPPGFSVQIRGLRV